MKLAARYMAKLWDRSIRRAMELKEWRIADRWASRAPEVRTATFLLSWMELALVAQSKNPGPGKIGLFELAKHFQTHPFSE